ncbi:MAG TPA: hypothetical protein VGV88_11510 [Candidatus Dormibacteraeota bacterium]|nr:hypothetical protein [Candidatus Dormibacteraeota bacterium]
MTIFAVTGDAVARFGLDDAEPELLIEGSNPRCIAIDPRDPQRVYVGTMDSGLWFSADGGDTWHKAGPSIAEPRVLSVAVSRPDSAAYAGTEPSNLYRSEDGGSTWQLLPALRELPSAPTWSFPPRPWTHHVRTIALHPTDPDWLAVGIELGGVMRSRDRGKTWIDHNPQALSDAHQLLTHPLAPDRLYEAAGQGIARSDDRGDTWRHLDKGLDRHYAWAQAIDPADPDLWYVAVSRSPWAAHGGGDGQARLLRSRGNGWEAVDGWGDDAELRRMPYALATLPDQPGRLLVGLRGGTLLITDDAGKTRSRLAVRLTDLIDLAIA